MKTKSLVRDKKRQERDAIQKGGHIQESDGLPSPALLPICSPRIIFNGTCGVPEEGGKKQ